MLMVVNGIKTGAICIINQNQNQRLFVDDTSLVADSEKRLKHKLNRP